MQIKVDFLCRDSILAAPIVLDLALFMDLAARAGESGVQEWLSFYFKAPQPSGTADVEHDLFIQQTKLKNTLREWMGEEPVTHSEAGWRACGAGRGRTVRRGRQASRRAWPWPWSMSTGRSTRQRSKASGHRPAKRQPGGRSRGLGGSPTSGMLSARSRRSRGAEANSALV